MGWSAVEGFAGLCSAVQKHYLLYSNLTAFHIGTHELKAEEGKGTNSKRLWSEWIGLARTARLTYKKVV